MVKKNKSQKVKKKKKLDATEEEPIRNLMMLLMVIPITPFIMLYYFATGKAQNSFILGSGLTVILTCFSLYGLYKLSTGKEYENKELYAMVEELSFEEQEELRDEYSTLRKSIGEEKFPKELEPMLDVEQNMLVINYYNYLINAGQIGSKGEGAIYILQNTLYGADRNAAKAAWASLEKINSDSSRIAMNNFAQYVEASQKELAEKAAQEREMPKGNSLEFYKNKFKNKLQVIKNSF